MGQAQVAAPTIPHSEVSGLIFPVHQRHRSTAICLAIATTAFLRAALLALGLPRTGHHFLTRWLSGCQITSRQASSIRAVRSRTLFVQADGLDHDVVDAQGHQFAVQPVAEAWLRSS